MQITNVRDVAREARGIRKRYMLRQGEVARAVGVTRQWISSLERAKPTLELGLVLRAFDELGLDLVATRRDPPPPWTVPLTQAAEFREKQSIHRLRKERMAARDRAWAIRQGNAAPDPDARELDDMDYYNMIQELREKRGATPTIYDPKKPPKRKAAR